ncbi:MAG: PH domain-containing protein [Alphaproteobacteria bacterium]|nr:PH domain-containing protein [Alphaproteobacteria bacterium]
MENYVEGSMAKDEVMQVRAKFHWLVWLKFYVSLLFWGIVVLLCGYTGIKMYFEDNGFLSSVFLLIALLALIYILWVFLKLKFTEMACTNKRIIYKTGVISLKTAEIKVDKIESIQIEQTFWGRIFGCGNIIFSGTGTAKVKFYDVSNPWQIKTRIEESLDEGVSKQKRKR